MNLTNEQLNEWLAVEVMGWAVVDSQLSEILPESRPPNLMITRPIYNWQSCTDLNQAWECAMAQEIRTRILRDKRAMLHKIEVSCGNYYVYPQSENSQDIARAICEAIYSAKRGEE